MMTHARLFLLSVLVYALLAAGCRGPEETDEGMVWLAEPASVEPVDVAGWWSNGQQLLRLDRDGQYILYGTPARMEPPQARGRWIQDTYARLTLEPYSEFETEGRTVAVVQQNGDLVLRVPGFEDFRRISSPEPTRAPSRERPPGTDLSNTAMR